MAAAAPQSRRITYFRSGADGYGDSVRAGRQHSYNRVYGAADLRWGDIREGSAVQVVAVSLKTEPPLPTAFEWEQPVGLQPVIYYVQDANIWRIRAGSTAAAVSLAASATGAAMHDDAGGVAYLHVAEGGASAANKVQRMDRAGTLTTCTNIYADKLLSIANDLYLTATPAGGTANCAVGKVAAGTNPATAAMPSLTVVGQASRPINNLVALRYAPISLKPEGIFSYDRNSDTWINHARWLEYTPHPDNGKAYWYEGTDLIVALGDGGALRFDGYSVTPYDLLPLDNSTPDIDTTPQLIACGGTVRHWGVAVTKVGAKRQRSGGATPADTLSYTATPMAFLKTTDAGGTYTDYSTDVSDGSQTTYAVLSALDPVTAPVDYFLVGHVQPWLGFYMEILSPNANVAALTGYVWNGAAWVAATLVDNTMSAAGATMARSGWIAFGADGGAAIDPIADPAYGWQRSTINGLTRYWMKLVPNLAFSATVQVSSTHVTPYRPTLDRANFPGDAHDRAGLLPHVLLSRTRADGSHVVHDLGCLDHPDEIGAVILGPLGAGQIDNDNRQLVLIGKRRVFAMYGSYDDRPATFSWPAINSLTPKALVELAALDLEDAHQLDAVDLDGYDFQRSGFLYYRFDDGRPWALAGRFANLPVRLPVAASQRSGRYLRLAVGWTGTQAQSGLPVSPRVTAIDITVTPTTQRPVRMQRTTAAPVV